MSRACRVCGRSRPNEQFGGGGASAYTCRVCQQMPRLLRQRILATEEVHGFLDQKNISKKNIARLEALFCIDDVDFQDLRQLVLDIAQAAPRKRKRWRNLRQTSPQLYERLRAFQAFACYIDDEVSSEHGGDIGDEHGDVDNKTWF